MLKSLSRLVLCLAVLLLGACAAPIPLTKTYDGSITPAAVAGEPVELVLELKDHRGTAYAPGSVVFEQYKEIAEAALRRAGYTIAADADLEVVVALEGRTPNGMVDNQSSVGRNILVSTVTLGIGCGEMSHEAHGEGVVTIRRSGQSVAETDAPLRASDTSCHSKLNPSWLRNHQEAGIRTYASAVTAHVAAWLPLLAGSAASPAS